MRHLENKINIHGYGRQDKIGLPFKGLVLVALCMLHTSFTYSYNMVVLRSTSEHLSLWFATRSNKTSELENEAANDRNTYVNFYKSSFLNPMKLLDATYGMGACIGALCAIKLAEMFGRKGTLLMGTFITIFGSLFCGYSKFFEIPFMLYFGIFLYGLNTGVVTVIGPIYIAELVPAALIPQYGVCNSLFETFGSLVGGLICRLVPIKQYWPLIISLDVLPVLAMLAYLPMCPESPKYLYVVKGKEFQCRQALIWLRGGYYDQDELYEIRNEFYKYKMLDKVVLKTILSNKVLKHAFMVTITLLISKQICGIHSVLQYLRIDMKMNTIKITGLLIMGSVIALIMVRMFCARTLLVSTFLYFTISATVICFLLGYDLGLSNKSVSESNVITLIVAILFAGQILAYKIGIGSFAYFMPMQLFTTVTIHYAYGVGMFCNWLLLSTLQMFYLPLQKPMGYLRFLNVIFINMWVAHVIYCIVPETRKKSIKDIYYSIFIYLRTQERIR